LNDLQAEEKVSNSPALGYLQTIAEYPVYPRPNGFDFKNGQQNLDLKNQSLSPTSGYLPSVAIGLKLAKNLRHLNFDGTKLTDQGLIKIVDAISI
jgi:hypothetical protein